MKRYKIQIAALDMSKAYDKVSSASLATAIRRTSMPEDLQNMCLLLAHPLDISMSATPLDVRSLKLGLPQGGPLAPFLFNIFTTQLITECEKVSVRYGIAIEKLLLIYADDVLLQAPNFACLQDLVSACENWAHSTGMIWNTANLSQ